jgi:hypothetical protein
MTGMQICVCMHGSMSVCVCVVRVHACVRRRDMGFVSVILNILPSYDH